MTRTCSTVIEAQDVQWRQSTPTSTVPPIGDAALGLDQPDAHWRIMSGGNTAVGHCSLWWKRTPVIGRHRIGCIGHYAACSVPVARTLLRQACAELAAHGCTVAVGPMDGSTWRRYRVVTNRGHHAPFFLEPYDPDDCAVHWHSAGFQPLADYVSIMDPDMGAYGARYAPLARRVARRGITIRTFDTGNPERELRHLLRLAQASFSSNFLFAPITWAEFSARYEPLLPVIRPELVILAEHAGHVLATAFGIPDVLQARRARRVDTLVIKTCAVHPRARSVGLGRLLMTRCQMAAREAGFSRCIHALMHVDNYSCRFSSRDAEVMRRYLLFSKAL